LPSPHLNDINNTLKIIYHTILLVKLNFLTKNQP
jgi:hypothetical protein